MKHWKEKQDVWGNTTNGDLLDAPDSARCFDRAPGAVLSCQLLARQTVGRGPVIASSDCSPNGWCWMGVDNEVKSYRCRHGAFVSIQTRSNLQCPFSFLIQAKRVDLILNLILFILSVTHCEKRPKCPGNWSSIVFTNACHNVTLECFSDCMSFEKSTFISVKSSAWASSFVDRSLSDVRRFPRFKIWATDFQTISVASVFLNQSKQKAWGRIPLKRVLYSDKSWLIMASGSCLTQVLSISRALDPWSVKKGYSDGPLQRSWRTVWTEFVQGMFSGVSKNQPMLAIRTLTSAMWVSWCKCLVFK